MRYRGNFIEKKTEINEPIMRSLKRTEICPPLSQKRRKSEIIKNKHRSQWIRKQEYQKKKKIDESKI